jgi:hypothetical protein
VRVGLRAPLGTHDDTNRSDDAIVVFPTGHTIARAGSGGHEPEPGSTPAPATAPPPAPATHGAPRQYHARPGPRPGATPGVTSSRAGGHTDIVRPLLVAPGIASRIVLAGDVFDLPVPHLHLDREHIDVQLLVWPVSIVGDRERPVPAILHLFASPSMIVTVLELVPTRRLRWGRERFLRYGIEAIDTLADRIERAA